MVTRTPFPGSAKTDGRSAHANGSKPRERPTDELWVALKRAWRAVGKRVPEMRDDLSCLAAVQADRARLAVRQIVTRMMSTILLVIAMAAVFATAASLVIVGISGGVASVLHGNIWLANIITGMAALILLFGALAISVRVRRRRRLHRLRRRYERYDARQRSTVQTAIPEARNHAERS